MFEHILRHKVLPLEFVLSGYTRAGLEKLAGIHGITDKTFNVNDDMWNQPVEYFRDFLVR